MWALPLALAANCLIINGKQRRIGDESSAEGNG